LYMTFIYSHKIDTIRYYSTMNKQITFFIIIITLAMLQIVDAVELTCTGNYKGKRIAYPCDKPPKDMDFEPLEARSIPNVILKYNKTINNTTSPSVVIVNNSDWIHDAIDNFLLFGMFGFSVALIVAIFQLLKHQRNPYVLKALQIKNTMIEKVTTFFAKYKNKYQLRRQRAHTIVVESSEPSVPLTTSDKKEDAKDEGENLQDVEKALGNNKAIEYIGYHPTKKNCYVMSVNTFSAYNDFKRYYKFTHKLSVLLFRPCKAYLIQNYQSDAYTLTQDDYMRKDNITWKHTLFFFRHPLQAHVVIERPEQSQYGNEMPPQKAD